MPIDQQVAVLKIDYFFHCSPFADLLPRCDKLIAQIKEVFVLEVMHEPLQSVMTVKSELLK